MAVILKVRTEYTTVHGISIRESKILEDNLRYFATASATPFNPQFASGKWDGFVRLYDRFRSRFPTGLLARVKRTLTRENIPFEVVKELPDLPSPHPIQMAPSLDTLRAYQEEAVMRAVECRRGIIRVPTGGGKTLIAQHVIHRTQSPRTIFLVPNRVLLNQTYKRFKAAFPELNVIRWGDGAKPTANLGEEYLLISTVQSAWKQSDTHHAFLDATMAIVDECHHQSATTFHEATRHMVNARYLLGLSATPFRDDGADMEMEAWLGPVLYEVGYEELINAGYLVPPEFHLVRSLEEALHKTRNLRTLIFAEKISDLEREAATFKKNGIVAHTGRDKTSEIKASIDALVAGKITHIAATPIFDEGLDIPELDAVIFYASGRSRVRTLQRIGRAMRPSPGKEKCVVVDLLDQSYADRRAAYLREPAFAKRLT